MVSFSCENCGDVLTKKKLDPHRGQCRGASYTCIDCHTHFHGTEYRSHTSCISEAQKYQKSLYDNKKGKGQNQAQARNNNKGAVAPRKPYVEDALDPDTGAVAIVDAPPAAPSPPPVNVFDFLVENDKSHENLALEQENGRMIDSAPHEMEHDSMSVDKSEPKSHGFPRSPGDVHPEFTSQREYDASGFGYGAGPVPPTFERFDSSTGLTPYPNGGNGYSPYDHPSARTPGAAAINYKYVTPGPNHHRTRSLDHDTPGTSTTKKKRKRGHVEDLDLSGRPANGNSGPSSAALPHSADIHMTDATPGLHTGLTGGLSRMMQRPDFEGSPVYPGDGGFQDSPLSPMKRAKQADGGYLSEDVRKSRAWMERERDRDAGQAEGKSSRLLRDVAQRREEREREKQRGKEKDKNKDKDKDKDKERGRSRVADTLRRITSGSSAHTTHTTSTGVTADGALVMVRKSKKRESRRHSVSSDSDSERERDRRAAGRRKPRLLLENGNARDSSEDVMPAPRKLKAIEYHRERSSSGDGDSGALVLHPHGVAGMGVATARGANGHRDDERRRSEREEAAPRLTSLFPTASARQELFLQFVTKGPESERGCSVNKALKRWHRERYERWYKMGSNGNGNGHAEEGKDGKALLSKAEEEKELWRGLRLRRNDRGEVVVFF